MRSLARRCPVALRYRATRVDRDGLRRLLARCLESEGAPARPGIGVVLAGSRLVRRLNREYRGMDRATDVLSFSYEAPPPLPHGVSMDEPSLLGEVLISVPRCLEQARERGVDPGVELARLLIHGALHVLGHDHEKPAERARMVAREKPLRAWAAQNRIGPGLLRVRGWSGRSAGGSPRGGARPRRSAPARRA